MWSKKFDKCKNCLTTLYKYKANGYCSKCYRVFRKINLVDNASPIELVKLRVDYLSFKNPLNNDFSDRNELKKVIKSSIKESSLYYIELYGKIKNNILKVNLLRLENIFNEISRRVITNPIFILKSLQYFKQALMKKNEK